MKFIVNGVEYTDYEEAKKAEAALAEATKKKAELAEAKKARADEVKEAFAELQKAETEEGHIYTRKANELYKQYKRDLAAARAEYSKAIKEAQDKYDGLKNAFISDYGSFHLSYFNNGSDQEVSVSDLVDKMFNMLSF